MEVLYGLHPVEEALRAGKRRFDHVLVARERHDDRLERLAAAGGGQLKYGAAVAGGIPVIPGLEQGLAGDQIVLEPVA